MRLRECLRPRSVEHMVARLGAGNKRTGTAAIAMREQRLGKNACHAFDASIAQSRWDAIVPIRRLFIGPPNPENRSCIVGPPDELQTTRQALLGKPIEHRQRATLEEIHGTGKAPPSRCLVHVIQRDGRRPDGRRGQDKTSKASRAAANWALMRPCSARASRYWRADTRFPARMRGHTSSSNGSTIWSQRGIVNLT
jgi:hypothetical protein